MNIIFKSLNETDFPLLLKWLEEPHVKAWWDQDVIWTLALIKEKYMDCVKGYRIESGIAKKIDAYIIVADQIPIGYIQIYNAYDFARSHSLHGLPVKLAAFDIFIGEENYVNRGVGSQAMFEFLQNHTDSYTHIFVDPEITNMAAIRAYQKIGFKKTKNQPNSTETWMILEMPKNVIGKKL